MTHNSDYSLKRLWHKFRARPSHKKAEYVWSFVRGIVRFYKFSSPHLVLIGKKVKIQTHGGRIVTGGICVIHSECRIAVEGVHGVEAMFHIGEGTEIGDRTTINVSKHIKIGNRCSISWDCDISDTDFHHIFLANGAEPPVSAPVIIEDDVWIGSHCLILKGVTIGHNSVVAAGSVLRKSVPPYSLVVGNPARRISQIDGWER